MLLYLNALMLLLMLFYAMLFDAVAAVAVFDSLDADAVAVDVIADDTVLYCCFCIPLCSVLLLLYPTLFCIVAAVSHSVL